MRTGLLKTRIPFPYTPSRTEYKHWKAQCIQLRPGRRTVFYWLKQIRKRDGLQEAYKFRDWLIFIGHYPHREIPV